MDAPDDQPEQREAGKRPVAAPDDRPPKSAGSAHEQPDGDAHPEHDHRGPEHAVVEAAGHP